MASMLKFAFDKAKFENDIRYRTEVAEAKKRTGFVAARRIQSWYRGILVRDHLRMLHEKATIIQRHWRGYRGRITAERYLIERVAQMWQDYYDRMATRIQAAWRGYWTRKTAINFREMKQWLKSVYKRNGKTLERMREFRRSEIEQVERAAEKESMLWILFILFKVHHLLGTKQRPGMITEIDRSRFTAIERMLKCLEYRFYSPQERKCKSCEIDPKTSLIFRGTYLERCEREIREMEKSLRTGNVSILRGQSYDEQEKTINATRRGNESLKMTQSHRQISCNLKKTLENHRHSKSANIEPCDEFNDLYETILQMNCHFHRLHLKCPVHDDPLSFQSKTKITLDT